MERKTSFGELVNEKYILEISGGNAFYKMTLKNSVK